MKRTIIYLMLAASSIFTVNSQILYSESFVAPFSPAAAGWDIQNLSSPLGVVNPSWFQGVTSQFSSFSGAPTDYYASNFGATAATGTNNTISSWFITPTLNLVNGAVIQFYTRTSTNPNVFADRLQLYISTAGAGTNVGVSAGSATNTAGTFTNILLDINPNLTLTNYPVTWTQFSATVTGVPSPIVGRAAFRYYVTQGGNSGLNSNYIGIDDVKYSLSCTQPTLAIAQSTTGVCSGNTVSLTASTIGSVSAASYTWSNGQNLASIVVSPSTTTIYTLSATSNSGCVGTQTVAITVTATPNMALTSYTVCTNPATSVTLTASGAVSYSWSTGATTSSIVETPTITTAYTVTGFGSGGSCPGSGTATITLGNQLSIAVTASPATICSGQTVTLTATGAAASYSWNTGATSPVITVTPNTTTTYSVAGLSGFCLGGNTIQVTVNASPSISVSISPTICTGGSLTINASGANTYTYLNSSANPHTIASPTTAGTYSFLLVGTGLNGCLSGGPVGFTVDPSPTVAAVSSANTVCVNNTVTLTGSGAVNYAWTGAATSSSNPYVYTAGATAGAKVFTVTGTSLAGCSGTSTLSISVVSCTVVIDGIEKNDGSASSYVFPNPFTNELKLSGLEGSVEIYNTLGQVVLRNNTGDSATLNTSELPKGAYILKGYNTQGELTRTIKLLKN